MDIQFVETLKVTNLILKIVRNITFVKEME